MNKTQRTNYFCEDCYKTYTEYYKNGKFTDKQGQKLTRVYGKCDNCNGDLKID